MLDGRKICALGCEEQNSNNGGCIVRVALKREEFC
jgi:hypothetical protein